MWHDRFSSALNGDTFWPLNRTFNAQKMVKETSLGAKGRLFQILNTVINQKMQEKIPCHKLSKRHSVQYLFSHPVDNGTKSDSSRFRGMLSMLKLYSRKTLRVQQSHTEKRATLTEPSLCTICWVPT